MYDPHTKESRGFGFVMMYTSDDAVRAVETLNQREFNGKIITVAHVSASLHIAATCSTNVLRTSLVQARRARARTPTPGRYYGPPKTGMYSGGGAGGGGEPLSALHSATHADQTDKTDRFYEPRSCTLAISLCCLELCADMISLYLSVDDSRYQGGSRGYDDRDRGGYDRSYERGPERGGRCK